MKYDQKTRGEEAHTNSLIRMLKQAVLQDICECMESQFSSFGETAYKIMQWVNHISCELHSTTELANHFLTTLSVHGVDGKHLKKDRRTMKITVKKFFAGETSPRDILAATAVQTESFLIYVCWLN